MVAPAIPAAPADRTEPAKSSPDPKPSDPKIQRTHPPEKNGTADTPRSRRGAKKRRAATSTDVSSVTRYFLAKDGNNGKPELDREVADENQAMIEALKQDGTYLALTEWRPKVDNSTNGRPVIEKEAVSRTKQ